MSEQAVQEAFMAALDKPIPCVGGPADGKTTKCAGAAGVTFPVQTETERFYWHDKWGLTRSQWDEALYKLDRGEDGLPVLRFQEMKRSGPGKLVLERPLMVHGLNGDTALVRLGNGSHATFSQEELAEMHAKGLS